MFPKNYILGSIDPWFILLSHKGTLHTHAAYFIKLRWRSNRISEWLYICKVLGVDSTAKQRLLSHSLTFFSVASSIQQILQTLIVNIYENDTVYLQDFLKVLKS